MLSQFVIARTHIFYSFLITLRWESLQSRNIQEKVLLLSVNNYLKMDNTTLILVQNYVNVVFELTWTVMLIIVSDILSKKIVQSSVHLNRYIWLT